MAIAKVRDLASAQNLSVEATTVLSLSGIGTVVAVGNHVILRVAADNSNSGGSAPGLALSDSQGHTWVQVLGAPALQDPGAANAGSTCWIWYAYIDEGLGTSDSITLTWSGAANPAAKAVVAEEWTGIRQTNPMTDDAIGGGGSGTAPNVGSLFPESGSLCYCGLSVEGPSGDTYTQDADSVNGTWSSLTSLSTTSGTAAANQTIRGAYKVVSAAGQQTWTPTITSRDWASINVEFFGPAPDVAPPPISYPHRNPLHRAAVI